MTSRAHFPPRINEGVWLAIILLVVLATRLLTVTVLSIEPVSDYAGYRAIASNFVAGKGLNDGTSGAFLSAGYPLFMLVPIFAIFGDSPLAAQVGNSVLCVVTAWLIYRIASELGLGKAGRLLAPLLFAVYIPSWIYAEYLAKENLMAPLMMAVIWLSLLGLRSTQWRIPVALGVVLAIMTITGNAGLSILPVPLIAMALIPEPAVRRWQRLGLMGLVYAVTLAPWLIRNDQLLGEPVVNSNGGFNLYIGNNPSATGEFVSISDTPRGKTWHKLREEGELKASNTLKGEAIAWIQQHPAEFAALAVKKAGLLWMPPVHEGKETPSKAEQAARSIWLVEYLLLIAIAVFGLTRSQLRTPRMGLVWVAILGYTAIHMIFYVIFRYREPIMPLVIVLAAAALDTFWKPGRQPLSATTTG